jgi:hypothetical protein
MTAILITSLGAIVLVFVALVSISVILRRLAELEEKQVRLDQEYLYRLWKNTPRGKL